MAHKDIIERLRAELIKPPAAEEPTLPAEPEVDYHEVIHARLLGGAVIPIRRGNILGYCHNVNHPGKLTKTLLAEHQCR